MHANSGLRVVLEWKIYRPDSVIAAVITPKIMDPRLANLIDEYIHAVSVCVDLLVDAGATRPAKDYEWPPEDFPYSGTLSDGRTYWCHGVGCAVKSTKGRTVDFDFGENGETNGFSVSRLKTFLGSNPQKFRFTSHDEMLDCFDAAKPEFVFSGYILYYLAI